jgi:RNA polymerase sigma-70 factor (ECF subfamily)
MSVQGNELIARAQAGDREAFAEIVARHERMIRGMVRFWARGRLDHDDLVQEIYLRAWRSLGQLEEPLRFLAWLQGIARNVCRTALRRLAHEPPRDGVEVQVLVRPEERTIGGADELLKGLPPDIGRAMRAKFCDDLSYREIAARNGLTHAQVRHLIEKGLRLVATRLRAEVPVSMQQGAMR